MQTFGIDLSVYQKGINFDKIVAEGVKFVVLRGAYHLTKDEQFELFYREAKRKKLPVGVYLYTMAKTPQQAREEAEFLIEDVLKGKQFELPIYMDIEDEIYYSKSKSYNSSIVRAFCDRLEADNYFTGLYSFISFFNERLDDASLKSYSHWVAQWSVECTYKDKSVLGMWQFGGETNELRSTKIAGYVCDQNYMFRDFPKIIKEYGLNGFKKPSSVVGDTLKRGDRGIGVYILKKNLEIIKNAALITQAVDDNDIFGDGTQKAVIQVQKLGKIKDDGIVGEETVRVIEKLISDKIK